MARSSNPRKAAMPDRVDGADTRGREGRDVAGGEISVFDEELELEIEGLDEEEEVEDLVDILDEASLIDAIDESADDVVDAYGDADPREEREGESVESAGDESDESPDEVAVNAARRGRGRRH